QARIKLALTDPKGKPAPGAVSLAAVDEAVFSVLDQAPGREQAFYTIDNKLLEALYYPYTWSPEMPGKMAGREENRVEQALFARTAQSENEPAAFDETKEEESPRESKAGYVRRDSPYSLAASSFAGKTDQVEQKKKNGLKGIKTSWIVLVVALCALGSFTLWWFVRPIWKVVVIHGVILIVLVVMATPLGFLKFNQSPSAEPRSRGLGVGL